MFFFINFINLMIIIVVTIMIIFNFEYIKEIMFARFVIKFIGEKT
jgi:hypothetical protein